MPVPPPDPPFLGEDGPLQDPTRQSRHKIHAHDRDTGDCRGASAAGGQAPSRITDVRWRLAAADRWPSLFRAQPAVDPNGWITYQLTGLIHVCEQYGELRARRPSAQSRTQAGR